MSKKKAPRLTVSELRAAMGCLERQIATIEQGLSNAWDFELQDFKSALVKLKGMVPPGKEEAARPV